MEDFAGQYKDRKKSDKLTLQVINRVFHGYLPAVETSESEDDDVDPQSKRNSNSRLWRC